MPIITIKQTKQQKPFIIDIITNALLFNEQIAPEHASILDNINHFQL